MTAATTPDHIIPLGKGGTDTDDNIQCLCQKHHDQKTRKDMGWRGGVPIGVDGWPVDG